MSDDPKATLLAARTAQYIGADFAEKAFSLVHASIQAGGKGIAIDRNTWEHGKMKALTLGGIPAGAMVMRATPKQGAPR